MLKALHTIVLILLACAAVTAQEVNYAVLDKDNNQPVPLAYVNLYKEHALLNTVQTNDEGMASFSITSYPCKVSISIAGYETYSIAYDSAGPSSTKIFIQRKFSTLNEVIVTGVTQPVKLKDALSNYQVIPRSVIQAQGAVTLNDVLSKQLNTTVSGYDDVLGTSMRMQGMGGDKVKILMDGMPVNGRENGNINLSQISMNNVDRIEVIQGPMSVVYGTDAIGGVINIISKEEHKPFGFHAGVYLTTVNKYNAEGSVTFAIKKRSQLSIGGGRNYFEGWKNIDQPVGYHGDTMRTSRCFLFKPNEQYIGNIAYSYTAPSRFKLTFNSDLLSDKLQDRGSLRTWDPFQGAQATDQYFYTDRINNRLALQGDLGKSGHWISQNSFAYYNRIRKTVNKDLITLQENITTNTGDQDTTHSYDYSFRSGYSNNFYKLKYTVGYDVNMQFFQSLKLLNKTGQVQDYALYTELAYPVIADKLTLNAGLRGTYNTKYHPPVIPAFNLLFTPQKNIQIRASYAQSYRSPSLKEMYLDFEDANHNIHGNDSLKAENGKHLQLSASYQPVELPNGYLQFIASGYFNDVYNQITLIQVIDPLKPPSSINNEYTYANYAHLQNLISNLQADGQYRNLHASFGYSYIHNFSARNSYDPYGASEITATIQYLWHNPGINFSFFYKHISAQPFLYVDFSTGEAFPNGHQAAYSICDASIEKKLYNKKVQIIAGIKNIFDVQRVETTGVTQSSPHGGGGTAGNMLPRSLFTSINVNID